jgi:hypothetical protein
MEETMTFYDVTGTEPNSLPVHFIDNSRGQFMATACGEDLVEPALTYRQFLQTQADRRCGKCARLFPVMLRYTSRCRICRQEFESPSEVQRHEATHALQMVSYRGDPPAFVVNCRGGIGRASSSARTLSEARRELSHYFCGLDFDFVVHTLDTQRNNTAVAIEYLVVYTGHKTRHKFTAIRSP